MYADIGFGGKFVAERWTPITFWISPGERALGGAIVTEFNQDTTQAARIITPFAATPDTQTPIPIVAALPRQAERLTFTVYDDRGSRVDRLEYSAIPGPDTVLLPAPLGPDDGLFVCIGRTSLPEAVRAWTDVTRASLAEEVRSAVQRVPGTPTDTDYDRAWRRVDVAQIQARAMPLSWIAYDGATVLVVDADASAEAETRAMDAVREWVKGGGRLLIVASPGSRWRAWFPEGPPGEFVVMGDPLSATLPQDCAHAMRMEAARDRTDLLESESPDSRPPPLPPMPGAADRITLRPMTLTDQAAGAGWRTRWDSPAGAGLAEGPVGLGWITLIGMDPRNAASVLSARASGAVWRDALLAPASGWLESAARDRHMNAMGMFGDDAEGESALIGLLSRLANAPAVGDRVFVAIGGCMLALALLVGPGDWFVLKQLRARQRSWLTALAWIGVASAGAYAAPVLMRSGPSQITRVTMQDLLVARPGQPGTDASAQTGLTGIFGAQAGTLTFAEPDQSSWWRGVSAVQTWMPGQRRITGTVQTTQDAAGGMLGASRGNPLERLSLGLWTFRTFMDHACPDALISADVRRNGHDWVVTVNGVPEGVRLQNPCLRVGSHWLGLQEQQPEAGQAGAGKSVWLVRADHGIAHAPQAWLRAGPNEWYAGQEFGPLARPGMAASLPGALERHRSIDQRVASGRWAVIYLHADDWPSDVAVDRQTQARHTRVMRLIVPLREEDHVEPIRPQMVPRGWDTSQLAEPAHWIAPETIGPDEDTP